MIVTRKVRIQLTVFVVLALLFISYIAVRYVGAGSLVGSGDYTAKVEMPDSGGIFPNAEVTYRGVPVGRVGDMRLTASGIEVDLDIRSSAPDIPSNVQAVVANRSVIGEQYVDLRPQTDSGPFLTAGSVISSDRTARPPTSDQLLAGLDSFVSSVPITSLQTTVSELGDAFNGLGPSLQALLDSQSAFLTTADVNFPATATLIDTSATVLKTQQAASAQIAQFSANLRDIASTLASSDSDLRALIAAAPLAANQVTTLIDSVGPQLGTLLGNLLTGAQITNANLGGLQGLLVQLPQAISIGSKTITGSGINTGLGLTFFDPLPCTSGYESTPRRGGLDTSPGSPFNTAAGCTAPASSGTDVRGSQHAVDSPAGN
ncbi:MCE family protein [Jatrophihabitans sp. YIM 134969]